MSVHCAHANTPSSFMLRLILRVLTRSRMKLAAFKVLFTLRGLSAIPTCGCRLSLVSVVKSFQAHLDRQRNRDAPMRPTAVALCESMRSVRFMLQNNRDLEAAADVLPRLSPLQPLIKDLSKKSTLQHAMCETLTDILRAASADGAVLPCPLWLQGAQANTPHV